MVIAAYLFGLFNGLVVGYDIAKGRGFIGRWWNNRCTDPWWVVRYKDGGFEPVQAESRVMARFAVETRDGGTGHDCGHPDHIGWIEGPFSRNPKAVAE